jgi:hypothetical protein
MQILLSLDSLGSFRAHPAVETFTCVAFRLEPEMDESLSRRGQPLRSYMDGISWFYTLDAGHISLDGEDVAYGPIQVAVNQIYIVNTLLYFTLVQAEVHSSLLRIYGPAGGVHDDNMAATASPSSIGPGPSSVTTQTQTLAAAAAAAVAPASPAKANIDLHV